MRIRPYPISAVVVTRGDVGMDEVRESLRAFDEVVVWDNSRELDYAVYGRYAAIARARNGIVYVQDDDCLLEPDSIRQLVDAYAPGRVACNMPERFRHDFYADHALVGFGAIFDRGLPDRAFWRFLCGRAAGGVCPPGASMVALAEPAFARTCDIVFTALTPRVLVDVPYADREFASDPNRMWRQPDHVGERQKMLDLVRRVRDTSLG